jgi:hypothetical protein
MMGHRPYLEHGGKLLMYHGWADPLIPSQSSINYFNALVANGGQISGHGFERASFDDDGHPGLRRTQSYARLFMVPAGASLLLRRHPRAASGWPSSFKRTERKRTLALA